MYVCMYVCMYDDNLFLQDSADRIRELRRALEELRYEKEICDAKIVRTEALEVRLSHIHTYIHTYFDRYTDDVRVSCILCTHR